MKGLKTPVIITFVFICLFFVGNWALNEHERRLKAEDIVDDMQEALIVSKARSMACEGELDNVRGVLMLEAGDTVYRIEADEIYSIKRGVKE